MPSFFQHPYLQKIIPGDVIPEDLSISIYGAMLALWHTQPRSQRRFPLYQGQAKDYWRWAAWCATQGLEDSALLREISAWKEELALPIKLPKLAQDDLWEEGFSLKMLLHGIARYGYYLAPLLQNAKARHATAVSYWRGGRHRGKPDSISMWQQAFLKKKFGTLDAFLKALRRPYRDRGKSKEQLLQEWKLEDVVSLFSTPVTVTSSPELLTLPQKFREEQQAVMKRLPRWMLSSLAAAKAWLRAQPSEKERAHVTQKILTKKNNPFLKQQGSSEVPFGVNLFGYAQGELGIGEDLRQMALAFQAHDIPFCIINVSLSKNFSQGDHSMDAWLVEEPRYGINLFCMNGIEMVKFLTKHGLHFLKNRYTIGLWPWELPSWPESCHYAFACVDEIWGISSFTAASYKRAPCPVTTMNPPVSISEIGSEKRADFGLPEEAYLYLFCFDLHSGLQRKNPWGLLRTFQKAFPKESPKEVGLVFKISHSRSWRWPWPLMRIIARCDSRIHLLEKNMPHATLFALYRACDCYVSLHRAEGFGRTLAEALLLGLQVIATGFSGNLDFCKEPRTALVKSNKRYLRPKDYFWGEGHYWEDPCPEEASRLLREIRLMPRDNRIPLIDLSPETLGTHYKSHLEKIWNALTQK